MIKSTLSVLFVAMMANTGMVLAQEYDCRLSAPIELDDGVTLEQVKNAELGTYTMRLSYTGGQAWVGIGINKEGDSKMVPGSAVIGRLEAGGSTSVLKYNMESDEKDGSGVLPVANQNLVDATFVQTETESILTFTQLLTDDGKSITDESSWIFAVGLEDNQWEGKHKIHGSFFLPLSEDCTRITRAPTPSPTPSHTTREPTPEPPATAVVVENVEETDRDTKEPAAAPTEDRAYDLVLEEEQVEEASIEEALSQGQPNSAAVVSPTSTVVSGSTTASSTSSSTSTGIVMRQDETETTHPLWIAHGWTLAVAWGILAPLAIGAGVLRQTVGRYLGAANVNWYQLHFYLNLLVVALTIVGFSLAVAATRQEGKPHFEKQDDTSHHQAGLAIFILVILQSAMGYFRPPAPAAAPAPAQPKSKDTSEDEVTEIGMSVSNVNLHPPSPAKTADSSFEEDSDEESSTRTPSLIRKAWEMQHRLTGAVVVGLAWYNCHTGYQLMEDNYGEIDNHTDMFWGWAAGIAGTIFLLSYVGQMR